MSILHERRRWFDLLSEGVKTAKRPTPELERYLLRPSLVLSFREEASIAAFCSFLAVKRVLIVASRREKPAI
jgi:hypothetical protein